MVHSDVLLKPPIVIVQVNKFRSNEVDNLRASVLSVDCDGLTNIVFKGIRTEGPLQTVTLTIYVRF